jgi:hypothetical protein
MYANAPTSIKPKRRQAPTIPAELRHDVVQHARSLARRYRKLFAADRKLKECVLRLERALLPPRPRRRGRPRNPVVTRAIALHAKLRRQFPDDPPRAVWVRIYEQLIPGYRELSSIEQHTAREELRERIAWRRRKRRPRKIRAEISIS